MNLETLFQTLNAEFFESRLPVPDLVWNGRLRVAAGRFIPGSVRARRATCIEIASYLRDEPRAMQLIRDTLAHEMVHYWLWWNQKPYGHTAEFMRHLKRVGGPRYNPVPKRRPPRYLYQCPGCQKEYPARRKLSRVLACAACCRAFSGGKFDPRFHLKWVKLP